MLWNRRKPIDLSKGQMVVSNAVRRALAAIGSREVMEITHATFEPAGKPRPGVKQGSHFELSILKGHYDCRFEQGRVEANIYTCSYEDGTAPHLNYEAV